MIPKIIKIIAQDIKHGAGRALLVGGCVRDIIWKITPKDYDIEVFGLPSTQLKQVITKYGTPIEAGAVFGVLKLSMASLPKRGEGRGEVAIDFSLPRREHKTSKGHRGFAIKINPNLEYKAALARRDFTINSIYLDPLTGEFIDPFKGQQDLKNKILRVTDKTTFADDPLRVLRAVQFVARFNLSIPASSRLILRATAKKMPELSKDRVWQEWRKMLLLSKQPSLGLAAARELDIIHRYHRQLAALEHIREHPLWHPEKNPWEHTKLALDQAAGIAQREKLAEHDKLVFLLATICHDLGKPLTSKVIGGIYRTIGHAKAGEKPARDFLRAIGAPKHIETQVTCLVVNHMRPLNLYLGREKASDAALRRLSRDLGKYGLSVKHLLMLSLADNTGIGEFPARLKARKAKERATLIRFLKSLEKRAARLKVLAKPARSVISGKELLKKGFKPGPNMGKVIKLAEELADQNLTKTAILKNIAKITSDNSEKQVIVKLQQLINRNDIK